MKANPSRRLLLLITTVTCAILVSSCGSSRSVGLAYRLTEGDLYRYQYYEWLSTRSPSTSVPETSLEVSYDVTVTVAEVGRREVRLDIAVENVRAQVLTANGRRDWQSTEPQTATLYLRPGTGEITDSSGEISLDLPGTRLNPLLSLRQSLHQYPNKSILPGATWPSQVHTQLAREIGLSDGFQAMVTYTADEIRNRVAVARLAIEGKGALREGPGSLSIRTDALVSRPTGMPVEEQTQLRMESNTIVIEARSSLTLTLR